MKLLFSLSLSLCIAVGVCAMLISLGYLKIGDDISAETIYEVSDLALKQTGDLANEGSKNLQEINTAMPTSKIPAQNDPGPITGSSIQNLTPSSVDQAEDFLDHLGPGQAGDIEYNFTQFLKDDLKLNNACIHRIVRMCFWKNFVTLQTDWQTRDLEGMIQMYENETRLKKAGFSAKGLPLFSNDLKEAKGQFLTLKNLLSQSAGMGNGENHEIDDDDI